MLKYANIKGFKGLGEAYMGAHLYQWKQEELYESMNHQDKYGAVILIRAYDIEVPKMWAGYIFNGNDTYINGAYIEDGAIDEVVKLLGKVDVCEDFKDFIKGHYLEKDMGNLEQTTWPERYDLDGVGGQRVEVEAEPNEPLN